MTIMHHMINTCDHEPGAYPLGLSASAPTKISEILLDQQLCCLSGKAYAARESRSSVTKEMGLRATNLQKLERGPTLEILYSRVNDVLIFALSALPA